MGIEINAIRKKIEEAANRLVLARDRLEDLSLVANRVGSTVESRVQMLVAYAEVERAQHIYDHFVDMYAHATDLHENGFMGPH